MTQHDHWYRYVDVPEATILDEYDDTDGPGGVRVHCHRFVVLKYTRKGAWLEVGGSRRFVLREARRRFACPTLEEAKASFLARKHRQLSLLRAQVRRVEHAIREVGA